MHRSRQPLFGPGLWPFLAMLALIVAAKLWLAPAILGWIKGPPVAVADDPLCLRTERCAPVTSDPAALR